MQTKPANHYQNQLLALRECMTHDMLNWWLSLFVLNIPKEGLTVCSLEKPLARISGLGVDGRLLSEGRHPLWCCISCWSRGTSNSGITSDRGNKKASVSVCFPISYESDCLQCYVLKQAQEFCTGRALGICATSKGYVSPAGACTVFQGSLP